MADNETLDEVLANVRDSEIDVHLKTGIDIRHSEFAFDKALAVLLVNGVVGANALHWRRDLAAQDQKLSVLLVDCSDVFAWGVSDSEPLPFEETKRVYRMWRHDRVWGSSAWAVMARGQAPHERAAESMAQAGWDVAALIEGGTAAREYIDGFLASSDESSIGLTV